MHLNNGRRVGGCEEGKPESVNGRVDENDAGDIEGSLRRRRWVVDRPPVKPELVGEARWNANNGACSGREPTEVGAPEAELP